MAPDPAGHSFHYLSSEPINLRLQYLDLDTFSTCNGYSGRNNGQREHHYLLHDTIPYYIVGTPMVRCIKSCLAALTFIRNPPDSMPPGASLSPFRRPICTCPGLAAPGSVDKTAPLCKVSLQILHWSP